MKNLFALKGEMFDSSHRFETSWLLNPWALFSVRVTIFIYTFFVLIFNLIWHAANNEPQENRLAFSYFTNLTYWGITFYFLFAALHTFSYAAHGVPYLNHWPRPLQALHSFYYTTIVTFPFLVTIVYWAILYGGTWYDTKYKAWSNISQHAMNSLFALVELLLTRTNPPPVIHSLGLVVILGLYLGLAYLTYHTQQVYVYSFLDPASGVGKRASYIVGILVAGVVIFLIVKLLIWGRKWLTEKKWGCEGKFHGGRSIVQGDTELEAARIWEK